MRDAHTTRALAALHSAQPWQCIPRRVQRFGLAPEADPDSRQCPALRIASDAGYAAAMARPPATADDVRRLMLALGTRSKGPGRIYLTGGATAVLKGWRDATVDVDLKLDPEPAGVFEAIAALKDELQLNVELASPDQFIPDPPGSGERAEFIGRFGPVDFFHYDYYAQALAKIERGHARDLTDVRAMLRLGLIEALRLSQLFDVIEPGLLRFPAIDPAMFRAKLEKLLKEPVRREP